MIWINELVVMVITGCVVWCTLRWRFRLERAHLVRLFEVEKCGLVEARIEADQRTMAQSVLYEDSCNRLRLLEADNAVLTERLGAMRSTETVQSELFRRATDAFTLLSNEFLQKQGQAVTTRQAEKLNSVLDPVRKEFERFKAVFLEKSGEHALGLRDLQKMSLRLSRDAQNLADALKGNVKTQGNWGELILDRVLKNSALRPGFEYDLQAHYLDVSTDRSRIPDAVVHLPDDRDVVIDAKVNLVHYEALMNTTDDAERQSLQRAHLAAVRAHIRNLSAKRYDQLDALKSVDFVLMFMPVEGAFTLTVQEDPAILNHALKSQIALVGPSSLLVALRTIEFFWRRVRQDRNTDEIVRLTGAMLDKFAGFLADMDKIGTQLCRATDTYNDARGKLGTGRGNLIALSRKIKDLGVKQRKQLPQSFRDELTAASESEADVIKVAS